MAPTMGLERQEKKASTSKKKKRKPDKKHVARTPVAVARYKELFLAELAKGNAPGDAARIVKIARSTAYSWKSEDRDFEVKWIDAVETGLDHLETVAYKRAEAKSDYLLIKILQARRPEVWGGGEVRERSNQSNNFFLNFTPEEKLKRLERLGLPVPVIESDFEVIDAADDDANS